MIFTDKEFTPSAYQFSFLDFLEELVPNVVATLKSLVPTYEQIFGVFGCEYRMALYDRLFASKTIKGNYILFQLDPSVRRYDPDAPEPLPKKNPTLKNFLEFRGAFNDFIIRFNLEKDWLKKVLFKSLYDLSKNPETKFVLALNYNYGWNPPTSEPLNFEFEGWRIEQQSKDFERNATAAFVL